MTAPNMIGDSQARQIADAARVRYAESVKAGEDGYDHAYKVAYQETERHCPTLPSADVHQIAADMAHHLQGTAP